MKILLMLSWKVQLPKETALPESELNAQWQEMANIFQKKLKKKLIQNFRRNGYDCRRFNHTKI